MGESIEAHTRSHGHFRTDEPVTVKTLHLTNAFNDQSGGIATFYRALMDAANRQGREIRLVVPAEADRVEPVGVFGKIYHVRAPRAPLGIARA